MLINKKKLVAALILVMMAVAFVSVIANGNLTTIADHWLLGVPAKWSITCWPL